MLALSNGASREGRRRQGAGVVTADHGFRPFFTDRNGIKLPKLDRPKMAITIKVGQGDHRPMPSRPQSRRSVSEPRLDAGWRR